MEEYAQFVDVEPVTARERMECLLARLRKIWLWSLIVLVYCVLWGLQYGETSAVVMFLVGSAVLLIGAFPRARDVYVYRARKHHLAGDPTSAVANYRQALAVALTRYPRITTDTGQATRRVDPFYANTLHSLGVQYVLLNRAAEARAAFEGALAVRPDDPLLLTGLGAALFQQGHDEDAQAAFDKALALAPKALRDQSLLQRAISLFKIVGQRLFSGLTQERFIDASTMYIFVGDAYTGAMRYQEAIAAYERAIASDPRSSGAQHGLGNAYRGLGRHDEAAKAYQRALAGRGWPLEYRAVTYHNLGMALLCQERFPEAQAALEQAIALNRSMHLGYLGLARVHAEQGQYEEAMAELQRAMELEPHQGWAWLERARMETLRGDTKAALEYLAQALERGPRHAIRRRALEEKKLRPLHEHPRFRELLDIDDEENPTAP